MANEKSCGAIIFTNENNVRKYVIQCGVGIYQGYYGFPGGHVEAGETEQETALREVKEETGLDVVLYDDFRTSDEHALAREGRPNDRKTNVYFLADYQDQEITMQKSEVSEILLLDYDEAMKCIKYEETKRELTEAEEYLRRLESVLAHWGLEDPHIAHRYHVDSGRLIYRVTSKTGDFLLKGFPGDTPETTIRGNVQAHLFLGNEHGMAPVLYPTKSGDPYVNDQGHWFYLMEFIDGRQMEETPEDEYKLAQAVRKMHALQGYPLKSPMTQSKERYYTWFRDRAFVNAFDAILDALPDFEKLDQCFVHTDIGPHNAMLRTNGEVVFIDLDDTGIGSRYLDLGWPFIMQFVDYNHETEEMHYRFDLAQSFLRGYYGEEGMDREEYELLFAGAIQMHISYMQTYGPYAVDSLWAILRFGMEQKERLFNEML